MTIDFNLLETPDWIKKREEQWALIEWHYSDAYSKKELERVKLYFIKGIFPEKLSIPISYITCVKLFPFQSKEGHAYVFKNFPAKLEWTESGLAIFLRELLIGNSELLSLEERLLQFEWYMGREFDASRNFPFLIGEETEYRSLQYDHRMVLHAMLQNLNGWFDVDSIEWEWWNTHDIVVHLIPYMFSLLKVQQGDWLSYPTMKDEIAPDNFREIDHIRLDVKRHIRNLMRNAFIKKIKESDESYKVKKHSLLSYIQSSFNAFTADEYPRQIIDHWNYIKRRKILISASFSVDKDLIELWSSFFVGWKNTYRSCKEMLYREEVIGLLGVKIYSDFENVERNFVLGDAFFEDVTSSYDGDDWNALFSVSSVEIGEQLKDFLTVCPINDLHIEVSQIKEV